ncbi:MFS transporter [Chloroflexota bacterium]
MDATIEDKPRCRWFMLAWLMLISLIIGLAVAIMPPLFDEIKADLALTHAQIGIIWGAVSFGTLLSAIVGGLLGDRFGFKKIITLGLLVAVGACAMRAGLSSFWGLTLAMAILGIAAGLIYPNVSKAVGVWFPPRELGRALGLVNVEAALGWSVALMVGATLSSLMGG